MFWSELGLIDTHASAEGMFSHRQPSSIEDWEQLAWKLSDSGKFRQAAWAFDKASRPEDAADALAYAQEEEAVAAYANRSANGQSLLKAASALLVDRANKTRSRAAQKAFLRHAGDCRRKVGQHLPAANLYARADQFDDAAEEYLHGKDYVNALVMIRRSGIGHHVQGTVIQACRTHYLTIKVIFILPTYIFQRY
jgi:hypothetical protein